MQNSWCCKELIKFCLPNSSDDLCLFFCIYPSFMSPSFLKMLLRRPSTSKLLKYPTSCRVRIPPRPDYGIYEYMHHPGPRGDIWLDHRVIIICICTEHSLLHSQRNLISIGQKVFCKLEEYDKMLFYCFFCTH